MSSVIRFEDGVLVQVAVVDRAKPVSNNDISLVERSFSDSTAALSRVIVPVINSFKGALVGLEIGKIELEIGCTFTGEGGIPLICKAGAEANIGIKITILSRAAGDDG